MIRKLVFSALIAALMAVAPLTISATVHAKSWKDYNLNNDDVAKLKKLSKRETRKVKKRNARNERNADAANDENRTVETAKHKRTKTRQAPGRGQRPGKGDQGYND